jgi:hypothetical protein
VNNVADVGYMVMGTLGAKFAGSGVVELPSDIAGSREGAGAFWKICQDGPVAAEWSEVRPPGPHGEGGTECRMIAKTLPAQRAVG